jgi:hypothetical protein
MWMQSTLLLQFFFEEVNSLLKVRKERQPTKKKLYSMGQFLNFFCQRVFQKRGCATKTIFKKPRFFYCQGKFTNLVCGDHVTKMFNFVFVSKIKFPFQKTIFTRDISRVS